MSLDLPVNDNVTVTPERNGKVRKYYRSDVFDLLLARKALASHEHGAARRLQEDIALRSGVAGSADHGDIVDCSGSADPLKQRFKQSQLDAGRRIDDVLNGTGLRNAQLLRALIDPGIIRGEIRIWRIVVKEVTGESREDGQTALVRSACDNLAMAYQAYDAKPRTRRVSA